MWFLGHKCVLWLRNFGSIITYTIFVISHYRHIQKMEPQVKKEKMDDHILKMLENWDHTLFFSPKYLFDKWYT